MSKLRFALCTIALAAQAQQGSTAKTGTTMPRPDPALAKAFRNLVGTWRCSGEMILPKEMGGREVSARSSMNFRKELGGFAYSGDWKFEKNEAFPGMQGKTMWASDAGNRKLIEFSVDSVGDVTRGEADASGDDKMVWSYQGTMMGKPSRTRTTVTMKGKRQLELAFDAQGDGGWTPTGKQICTKDGG